MTDPFHVSLRRRQIARVRFPREPNLASSLRLLVLRHVAPTVKAKRTRSGLLGAEGTTAPDSETLDWIRRYEPQMQRLFRYYCNLDNAVGFIAEFASQSWDQVGNDNNVINNSNFVYIQPPFPP